MAENTIEIEVELKGGKAVQESLDALKGGAKDVGEGFKGVSSIMDKSSAQIGEGLSTMSEAVGSSIEAIGELKGAVGNLGSGGAASFMNLLGPIGLVTGAVTALWEGFRQLSGAAAEAEARQEAMAAAAGDLTSKLEALAEGGVVPTTTALLSFAKVTLQSQVAKELLQRQVEKSRPQMEAYTDALDQASKAQAEYNKLEAKGLRLSEDGLAARRRLTTAEMERDKAQAALNERLKKLQGPLQQNLELIAKAAKQEKELEESTTDNLKAKVKENAERLKTLQIADQEIYTRDAVVLANAKEQITLEAANIARQSEDMSRAELIKTVNEQKQAILSLTQADVEHQAQSAKQRRAFAEAEAKALEAEKKRQAEILKARDQAAKAEATRQTLLQSQIRQLDIKLTKEGDAELLALARERYETGLQLAKDDAMKRAIVEKQYQLETQTVMDQAEAREIARLKRQDEADEKMQANAAARREKNLQRELANQKMLMDQVGAVIDMYGNGLAEAGVAALMFGEGFKKVAGEVLKGLAIESAVRALMEGAKALAALFVNPAAAAAHAKSAGLYTAAAAAARAGAGALGVGGSGTAAGGGTTASPSGAPQEAGAPQRERAETRETVVNINFGGAVIYDSQEAARRAMMNELVRTYNSAPRGSARFNMGR